VAARSRDAAAGRPLGRLPPPPPGALPGHRRASTPLIIRARLLDSTTSRPRDGRLPRALAQGGGVLSRPPARGARLPRKLAFVRAPGLRNSTAAVGRLYWEGLSAALLPPRHPTARPCWNAIHGPHRYGDERRQSLRPVITLFSRRAIPMGAGRRVLEPQSSATTPANRAATGRFLVIRSTPSLRDAHPLASAVSRLPRDSAFDDLLPLIFPAAVL